MYLAIFFWNVPSYFFEIYLAIFFGNVPSYFFLEMYLAIFLEMYLAICKARASWPRSWAALTAVSPTFIDNWLLIFYRRWRKKCTFFILWALRSEMYINSSTTVQWWPTMFWYFVSAPAFNSSSTIAEWPALQTGHGWDEVDHFAQKEWIFVLSRV